MQKKNIITSLFLFTLCFVVRLIYVSAQDICIDEPFSIYHAQGSINDILKFLKPTNNPPLFELLLHYWIKLFGISVFSVRFLPLLFGSAAVVYIYKIGAAHFSYAVGVAASLLYIFSSHAIYYAHDCRVYTLFLFLTVASVYYFSKIIAENFVKKDLIWLCIVNVLLVYAHYFGFIIWFVEFLTMVIFARKKSKSVLIIFCIAVVCYLPQVFILADRFLHSTNEGTWVKEPVGLESIYNMIWLFSNMPVVAVACLLIMVAALIKYVMKKNDPLPPVKWFIFLCFFLPFFLMFLISYKIPVYNGRYLFFILPFYYLGISIMTFDIIGNMKLKYALLSVLVGLFLITVQLNPDKKRESKAVVEFIKKVKQPNDLVIICTHEFLTNFAYYYDQDMFKITSDNEYEAIELALKNENIFPVRNISEIPEQNLKEASRIIYLDAGADFSNGGNKVLSTLENNFVKQDKAHFREIFTIYTFHKAATN